MITRLKPSSEWNLSPLKWRARQTGHYSSKTRRRNSWGFRYSSIFGRFTLCFDPPSWAWWMAPSVESSGSNNSRPEWKSYTYEPSFDYERVLFLPSSLSASIRRLAPTNGTTPPRIRLRSICKMWKSKTLLDEKQSKYHSSWIVQQRYRFTKSKWFIKKSHWEKHNSIAAIHRIKARLPPTVSGCNGYCTKQS